MKFLVIQTAFIGDVILATAVLEKLHEHHPEASIDIIVRKGNEGLLKNHPFIQEVIVWDKKQNKLKNLFSISRKVRATRYDSVFNLHRFASSGIIARYSGAKNKIGFDKNPLSFLYTKTIKHDLGSGKHEVERNNELIQALTDNKASKPKLYPSVKDYESTQNYKTKPYICMAPTSVWFTKQFPKEKWVELINASSATTIYLLGAPSDESACNWIISNAEKSKSTNCVNLAGKLNFLESAALMKDAEMNYVNDSAPMHLASAMNAATTAIFCSTIPQFGFGPLSDVSRVVETKEKLDCRPCGLHGFKACPKGHFKCGFGIDIKDVLSFKN